ncbi:hypothetical protein M9H77_02579 [Catharanthus roseus]|uniref:Uncharacterized protein n=1 Tax=Catharanthus roseus TaxID=4058 RepID=A0ACC0C8T2_CATRO|nr:hypothetical protein M9H77_02579 [Catharanthus roseus]
MLIISQVRWPEDVRERSTTPETIGATVSNTTGSTASDTVGSNYSNTARSTETYTSGSIDIDTARGTSRRSRFIFHYILLREPPPTSQLSCRSCSPSLTTMRMGLDITYHQDEACMGSQGQWLDKRFDWRCLGSEEEARLESKDVLGANDEILGEFYKSKHLEELHKPQKGGKKGQYIDFQSKEFWITSKADEEASATSAAKSNEFQLMTYIASGLSRDQLYTAGLEAAHLKAESSQATIGLPPCYLDAEQRIMKRVDAVVSSVYATFDKQIRRFVE